MEKTKNLSEYFKNVETTEEHNGYFCSTGRVLTIVILGSICGLRNVSQIHQWASDDRIRNFLSPEQDERLNYRYLPCNELQNVAKIAEKYLDSFFNTSSCIISNKIFHDYGVENLSYDEFLKVGIDIVYCTTDALALTNEEIITEDVYKDMLNNYSNIYSLKKLDIDNNGIDEIVYTYFDTASNCYSNTVIYKWNDTENKYVYWLEFGGGYLFEVVKINEKFFCCYRFYEYQ